MDLDRLPSLETDFLIVGSGIAGLFAAYKARQYGSVLVVTKQRAEDSNTELAQGGIAAAVDETDSPVLHLEDTLDAGAGLCDASAVEILVNEGPQRVMELVELGVRFDREGSTWDLGREGAHRRRRILHASDATGEEVARALIRECRYDSRISLREGCCLVDFLRSERSGRCTGCLILDNQLGCFVVCRAPVVIVATGGAGQLYQNTTNPAVATGDGAATAYRAGAELKDMEFVQFHPTVLAMPNVPHFLISEAVRGEGALLRNVHGERFMPRYHQMAELAPRDVVTRAIVAEMSNTQSNHVFLDVSPMGRDVFQNRFPNICNTCRKYGLDLDKGYIPVAPATHYIMGGIMTGSDGETNIPGLYACGEAACTGVHGANRLASNSLLEGLVFGARAVAAGWRYLTEMHDTKSEMVPASIEGRYDGTSSVAGCDNWRGIADLVRAIMWDKVGILRREQDLAPAEMELDRIGREIACLEPSRAAVEAINLLTLAKLTVAAARMRTESRGGHFRDDFPSRDDLHWLRHIVSQV
jgi:L-aspartate oxidase